MANLQAGCGLERCAATFGSLLTPREILQTNGWAATAGYDARTVDALRSMSRYITGFLTAGRPDLGREGAVCPFVARALEQHLIRLAACLLGCEAEAEIVRGMESLRAVLAEPGARPGAGAGHRAIVAVFPRLSEPEGSSLVARVQKSLKLSFIERGLMIGQFFPSCPEPGLWNPDFRPLRSPVISLAVRNITPFDAPFMLDRPAHAEAFVGIYGSAGEELIAKARSDRRR